MLKAAHAQESKRAAHEKTEMVIAQLCEMKLKEAVKKVQDGVEETLTYCQFPYEHWTGTQWGSKKYMNMKHLEAASGDTSVAG